MKDWKTTLVGIFTALLMVLVQVGVFTPEDSAILQGAITAIIGGIASIWLIFKAKDK